MTKLGTTIDLTCAPLPDPLVALTPARNEPAVPREQHGCTHLAVHEIVATLAALHGGLYRDEDGVWWTGDWGTRLASPVQQARWRFLNEVAETLGYDA